MSAKRCIPCEQHAEMHSGFFTEWGRKNEPCPQCEAHATMHAAEGCELFLVATVAIAVAVYRLRARWS